jgi:hypothetical protein
VACFNEHGNESSGTVSKKKEIPLPAIKLSAFQRRSCTNKLDKVKVDLTAILCAVALKILI